jgi:hypothetical protein
VVVSAARSLCASGIAGPALAGPPGALGAAMPAPGGAGRSLMMVLEARALLAREEARSAAEAGEGRAPLASGSDGGAAAGGAC